MLPESIKSFITKLFKATEHGEVRWMESNVNTYVSNHKDAIFCISHENRAFNFHVIRRGRRIQFTVDHEEYGYEVLMQIYRAALAGSTDLGALVSGLFD